MAKRKCARCSATTNLTRHHVTPVKVIILCRKCHEKEHGIEQKRNRVNTKVQPGTRMKRKKKQ